MNQLPMGLAEVQHGAPHISLLRLNVLRSMYALIAFGMGSMVWPSVIGQTGDWGLMPGVFKCAMAGLTLLALLGLRYPLKMLPLLFWEIAWKTIWLIVVALPQWREGGMSPDTAALAFETGLVILVYAAVPWDYVLAHFFKAPAEPWK